MADAGKVLVIEDEEQLLRMLRYSLGEAGYEVAAATTGRSAIEMLMVSTYGVVLLDLGLPDIDGKELIAKAREFVKTPILVISARGSEKEKIAALDLGANDYIAKPFDTGELLARIRVAFRTNCERKSRDDAPSVSDRGLDIDLDTRRALVNGRPVKLSRRESEMLALLARANGAIVAHEDIIGEIWGTEGKGDLLKLRVLAWQVRRKIEPDPDAPRFLIAETGEGYRLSVSGQPFDRTRTE